MLEQDTFNYKGYSKILESYVYSNEVRNRYGVKSDGEMEVTLRSSKTKEEITKAKVKDLQKVKPFLDSHGANKTQSVYVAVQVGKEWEIWNLQLQKSQLSGGVDPKNKTEADKTAGWWNFSKVFRGKFMTHMIEVNKFEAKKTDMTKYSIPKFELGETISDEDGEILTALDVELQEYLEWYFKKPETVKEEDGATEQEENENYPANWDDVND